MLHARARSTERVSKKLLAGVAKSANGTEGSTDHSPCSHVVLASGTCSCSLYGMPRGVPAAACTACPCSSEVDQSGRTHDTTKGPQSPCVANKAQLPAAVLCVVAVARQHVTQLP